MADLQPVNPPDAALAATRAEALARLAAFLPHAGRAYAGTRNMDRGPGRRSNVTMLASAVRRRLVTEEELARAAWAMHGAAADKFIAEVCWRTYWRGWLEMRPVVWRDYLREVAAGEARLGREGGLARAYARAVAGETGIDAFDFWARELTETGYLHNHARMSFASIWIFTLGLPWALGAAHFYAHLACACPASNTLSWRWVAGMQTAGKTYAARAAIIRDTSCGRFAVDARLAEHAPAPEYRAVPAGPLPPAGRPDSGLRTGLWVHTEDCHAEGIALGVRPVAIGAVAGIGGAPAALKRKIADTALSDATARAAAHYQCPVTRFDEAALEDAMADWAAAERLQQVVTPYAPVGPVADRMAAVEAALARAGVRLVRVRRPWDERAWPYATKGFFAFKAVIPKLLGA